MASAYNKGLPYTKIFKKGEVVNPVFYFDDQEVILSH
jgi:hypothetical protein